MGGRKKVEAVPRKAKRPTHAAEQTRRFYEWLDNHPELSEIRSRSHLFNLARKEGVISDDYGGRRWQQRKQKECPIKAM